MRKRILFLTGKMGGYNAMKPFLKLIKKSKNFDLNIAVTDQHLMRKFGYTYDKIRKDFEKKDIIKILSNQTRDDSSNRSVAISKILNEISKIFSRKKIDLVLLYGDRLESLVTAISCLNYSIPVAHFQGGDISGNIDEKIRHSITKLSDYHFVSNPQSKKRLIQMGEIKKNIFLIGDNHIDALRKVEIYEKSFYAKKFNFKINESPIIFMLHPENISNQENYKNSIIVLKELQKINSPKICIYPCSDIGFQSIIKALKIFEKKINFKTYKNIEFDTYIGLLKYSKFLIGNSSSGIIEASYLNLPVINLGNRQNDRLSSLNVINCDFKKQALQKAIKMVQKSSFLKNKVVKAKRLYGNGESYKKAFIILKKITRNKINLNKKFIEN